MTRATLTYKEIQTCSPCDIKRGNMWFSSGKCKVERGIRGNAWMYTKGKEKERGGLSRDKMVPNMQHKGATYRSQEKEYTTNEQWPLMHLTAFFPKGGGETSSSRVKSPLDYRTDTLVSFGFHSWRWWWSIRIFFFFIIHENRRMLNKRANGKEKKAITYIPLCLKSPWCFNICMYMLFNLLPISYDMLLDSPQCAIT